MKRDHSPERRSDKRGEERSLNLSPRRKDSRSPIPSRRDSRSPPRRRREDRSRRERSSRERSSRRERSPRDRSSRRERSPRDKSSRRERSPQDRSRDRSSRRDRSRSSRREDRRDNRTDTRRRYQPDETMTEIAGIPILPGESFFAYRTRARQQSHQTVWAPSPERHRSVSPEEKDVEKRHARKHKKKSKKKKKRYTSSEYSSSEEEVQPKKEVLEVDPSHLDEVEDLWVEKQVDLPDDLAPVGPLPLIENDMHDDRAYGGALLPGEGSAMAAYVQQGKRIPRRGEIGLSGDRIADFERAGYVMSGSRHQRMNAVRLRKENQVISAEEKRQVLQHAQEQKMKRENEIISGFREILSDKYKKE